MHIQLSQNKKILASAIVLFSISFSVMFAFLSYGGSDFGQVSVLDHGGENSNEEGAEGYAGLVKGDAMEIKYREIADAPKDSPVFVTDPEGNISFACEGFCSLLESDRDEEFLLGTSIFDYINPEDLPELLAGYTSIIHDAEKKEALGPFRLVFLPETDEKLVLLSGHPLLNKEGKVEKIIFVVNDLTQQVEELDHEVTNEPVQKLPAKVEEHDEKVEAPKTPPNDETPSIKELQKDPSDHTKLADKISYVEE